MIRKYVKRPIAIEAVRVEQTKESIDAIKQFCGDKVRFIYADGAFTKSTVSKIDEFDPRSLVSLAIKTERTGEKKASIWSPAYPGDYIIRGVKGEIYPCEADIFHETYAPATD